jgi:hypothetical protein
MANGRCRMQLVLVPNGAPPKGWRGRGVRAGNMAFTLPRALAEQRRVRELLAQSRELSKQMQAV